MGNSIYINICTLCFLNQLIKHVPWNICLQYPIRIWSDPDICYKHITQSCSDPFATYFWVRFVAIGCMLVSAGDCCIYNSMHGGKYLYIYSPVNLFVSDGKLSSELILFAFAFLFFIMHTTAIIKAIRRTPPRTAITITSTLTAVSWLYPIVALIAKGYILTKVMRSFLFWGSAPTLSTVLLIKYLPSDEPLATL